MLQKNEAVVLQRSELAEHFQCVPSQINYVLSTRFTPVQGYLVESRRGGGGFLRIVKLSWEEEVENNKIYHKVGDEIDQRDSEGFLLRLYEDGFITVREFHMLKAITCRDTLQLDLPERDYIRARVLQAALAALCRNDIVGRE